MKEDWTYKKLGEVTTFINGDRGKNYPSQNDFVDEGIPFINAGHLNNGEIDFSSMNYITEEKYNNLGSGKIKVGDLLFCLRGSLGKKAIVKGIEKGAIASSLVIIRCENLNNKYLYYYLESPQIADYIWKSNNGSSQPNLSAKSVSSFKLPIPSMEEQQQIVAELDLLSGMIEKQKAQIEELDKLSQSIFYDMFGDPTNNPKNFEVKPIDKVCLLKAGKAIKAEELSDYSEDLYPCFGGNGIRGYIDRFSHEGTFPIIGRQGALCGNVNLANGQFYATEHAVVVTPVIELDTIWLYYVLLSMRLGQYAHGVAQPGLSVKDINPLPIILPPLSLQQEFAAKIEAIEVMKAKVRQSLIESETLFNSRMDYYFN